MSNDTKIKRTDISKWETRNCIYDEMGLNCIEGDRFYAKNCKQNWGTQGKCVAIRFPNDKGEDFIIDILQGNDDVIDRVMELVDYSMKAGDCK